MCSTLNFKKSSLFSHFIVFLQKSCKLSRIVIVHCNVWWLSDLRSSSSSFHRALCLSLGTILWGGYDYPQKLWCREAKWHACILRAGCSGLVIITMYVAPHPALVPPYLAVSAIGRQNQVQNSSFWHLKLLERVTHKWRGH